MEMDLAKLIVVKLLELLTHADVWQLRHSAVLALKYFLAVRTDLTDVMLPSLLPQLVAALKDADDDVRAAAANVLVATFEQLQKLELGALQTVMDAVWSVLERLDDLTSSTASVLQLAALLIPLVPSALAVVRRLWRFFSHPVVGVRASTAAAVAALSSQLSSDIELLKQALQLLMQSLLCEDNPKAWQPALDGWSAVVGACPAAQLSEAALESVGNLWLPLISTRHGAVLDAQLFFTPATQEQQMPPTARSSPGGQWRGTSALILLLNRCASDPALQPSESVDAALAQSLQSFLESTTASKLITAASVIAAVPAVHTDIVRAWVSLASERTSAFNGEQYDELTERLHAVYTQAAVLAACFALPGEPDYTAAAPPTPLASLDEAYQMATTSYAAWQAAANWDQNDERALRATSLAQELLATIGRAVELRTQVTVRCTRHLR